MAKKIIEIAPDATKKDFIKRLLPEIKKTRSHFQGIGPYGL
jgi:hypothetical protein